MADETVPQTVNRRKLLTAERLREILDYEPDTGLFRWKNPTSRRVSVGMIAGGPISCGRQRRICMGVDGVNQYAHRLAWLWMTGAWPPEEIDHIDGDSLNNKWDNIRLANRGQNQCNRGPTYNGTSGYKGVTLNKECGKYAAQINVSGKHYYLGLFCTAKEAHQAYCEAARKLHGEFMRIK